MRLLRFFALLFILCVAFDYVGNIHICLTPPSRHPLPPSSGVSYGSYETKDVSIAKVNLIDMVVVQLLILILWFIFLQYHAWLHMCCNTYYVQFDTNLNLFKKNKTSNFLLFSFSWYSSVSFIVLVLLINDYETNFMNFFLAVTSPISEIPLCFEIIFQILSKFKKAISMTLFVISVIHIFKIATAPSAQYVCIFVLQIFCLSFAKESPPWVSTLLILISNDIEQNPGPGYHNNFFNFMNWNLNSLATNDFARVQLIEAHNSLHNYDLISICENSVTDSLASDVPQLQGYTFEPANHVTHGGVVGLFYKNSL